MTYPEERQEWGRPVEGGGEYARPDTLAGHLIIVFPVGYHEYLPTKFTVAGKKSDALCCDIVDLDDKDEAGQPGKVYRSSNLMQAQLIVGLRPFIGTKVLGRIGKGIPKNGMNPPWVITDMHGDAECLARAEAWRHANPDFVKTTFVARTESSPPLPQQQPLVNYGDRGNNYYGDSYPTPQPPQPQYPQPAPPPPPAPPQQQHAPVAGSAQLSNEEITMLQRMRQQKLAQEAAQQAQFGDTPPF